LRLLCASNLHVGRATYGIPGRLGLDPARLSMTAAWDALVDLARAESVDAVVIAGDLIDRENRRFEPLGPIERGLTALSRDGIPVIAVAGDEDADALRSLAIDAPEGSFRVLGRDGAWETATLTGENGVTVTIAGWSAPGRAIGGSPVSDLDGIEADVVVLHGTPAGQGRGFAPIPLDAVRHGPGRLWIAGAPMTPSMEDVDGTTLLAPGSAAALSPVDVGARGAWIVDLTGDEVDTRQVPLGAIRYDHVDVDTTGAEDDAEIERRVIGALHEALDRAVEEDAASHLAAVCAHLTLYGRTGAYSALPERLDEIQRAVDLQRDGVVLAITSVTNRTEPEIALGPLLERADPVGETARIIQALDAPSFDDLPPPYAELVRRTVTRLDGVHRSRVFAAVAGDPEPDLDAARDLLRREAWATLDALIRQRGIDTEGAA
jgi:DNA repair protein SbcD/Mre11